MLRCSKCKNNKDCTEFTKNKASRTGYSNWCKKCRAKNEKESKALWYAKNKEKADARLYRWREKNVSHFKAYKSAWNKANKNYKTPQIRHNAAKYRGSCLNATPKWSNRIHEERILAIYKLADKMKQEFDCKFEVDHIEPIQGKTSSGLHVWWNLQVMPASLNRSKGNKLENIISPRVSDNFEEYLKELKIYAELYQTKGKELWDKKPVG